MSSTAIRRRAHAPTSARDEAQARDAPRALVTLSCAWLVLMTGTNLATPLYAVYAERFRFSSLALTVIFAVYAIVLAPSLLLFGRLSRAVADPGAACPGRDPQRLRAGQPDGCDGLGGGRALAVDRALVRGADPEGS